MNALELRSFDHVVVRDLSGVREKIRKDTAAFVSGGGEIEQVPTGISGVDYQMAKGSNGQPIWEKQRKVHLVVSTDRLRKMGALQ